MAVIRYIGKYVNADDASICFDNMEIETAVKNLREGAEKLRDSAKRMQNAQVYYTKENLSVNGQTFDNRINRCSNYFISTATYMEDLADAIVNAKLKAFNKKQVEFNKEARQLDLIRIKQEQVRN